MIGLAVSFMLVILYSFMNYYIYLMMITFADDQAVAQKRAAASPSWGWGVICWFRSCFFSFTRSVLLSSFTYRCISAFRFSCSCNILVFPAFRSFLIQFNMFPVIQEIQSSTPIIRIILERTGKLNAP